MSHFTKGIDWNDPRLTRKPKIWLEYLCWCITAWMDEHNPYLPKWMRRWLYQHLEPRRLHVSQWQYQFWCEQNPGADRSSWPKPLPWPICPGAQGPFVGPWKSARAWLAQHRGGRSHRCEFTDRENGALYGGTEGGFMNKLFDQFIENISEDES